MCGIAGVVKFPGTAPPPWQAQGGDFSVLEAMSAAIAHRGPDGKGIFVDARPGRTAALLHRRLAIVDLPGGGQPMANEDGRVQVVFNGEIYNHLELRRELTAAGHRFVTHHSDTEVLVHGWEEWGADLPAKLLGMFAFAVWDMRANRRTGQTEDTLFLARDRMGQKPLFYATLEDGIVFGSTIASVLAWPEVPRRVPREQVALYLLLGYLPPPHTIYRDINQVSPGHWVRLRGEVFDGNRYWGQKADTRRQNRDPRDALRELLPAAVESQLMADVPIACFLSGGIDSSIVAVLMQRAVLARGGGAIHTVSVGFSEGKAQGFDETAYAAAVAAKIGSRHTRLEVNAGQNVIETLQMLMRQCLGQPFADSSIVPTYHLSKAVREIAPVALSGDGADELFAGYDRYRAMAMLERWKGVARFIPRKTPFGALARRERYRRLSAAARARTASERYTRMVEIFSPEMVEELMSLKNGEMDDFVPKETELGLPQEVSALRLAMSRDQREYLPGDVLWKVDSASMSPGSGALLGALEVRSPFLDHRVAEFANGLEDRWLLDGGRGKRILREVFAAELPGEILSRPKKGFGAPMGEWFKRELRQPMTDLLFARDSFVAANLNKGAVERLWREHMEGTRDHTHRLFALLMLEIWARGFDGRMEA